MAVLDQCDWPGLFFSFPDGSHCRACPSPPRPPGHPSTPWVSTPPAHPFLLPLEVEMTCSIAMAPSFPTGWGSSDKDAVHEGLAVCPWSSLVLPAPLTWVGSSDPGKR